MSKWKDVVTLPVIVYICAIIFTQCLCAQEKRLIRKRSNILKEIDNEMAKSASLVDNVEKESPFKTFGVDEFGPVKRNSPYRYPQGRQGHIVFSTPRRPTRAWNTNPDCVPGCRQCKPNGVSGCQDDHNCCSFFCYTKWYWPNECRAKY